MKKFLHIASVLIAAATISSCNEFFPVIPGEQYDLESTFKDRSKTQQFLNNVYSYVADETIERWPTWEDDMGGIWTGASIEGDITWSSDGQEATDWSMGVTYPSSEWVNYWYRQYYKGISKASTFLSNVEKCTEASSNDRKLWAAQARALRAFFYYQIFRLYGPTVILGDEALALDTPLEDLLKQRNTLDENIDFIVSEFDRAAEDLPAKYTDANLGRIDRGICKALKAKTLLYAASPLFNCNPDYANVKNPDGTQLFPQDKSQEQARWEKAKLAYEEFLKEFDNKYYKLQTVTLPNGKVDHYESYRQAASITDFTHNTEQIFIKLADHNYLHYQTTPYHRDCQDDAIRGGLGFGTTQEMVDLYFTDKGLRIVDDPDYDEYTGVPDESHYGWDEDYQDPFNPDRNLFKANEDKTLKQWAHREPRFYVCVTFNGSTWLNTTTNDGEVTTELNYNGNSGFAAAGWDAPYTGYGDRRMAPITGMNTGSHCAVLLRLGDMYLGYAECLSACGEFDEAMKYVNFIRKRAGIPGYGNGGGTDENGFSYIPYPSNRAEVDNRIRRERLLELSFEWNHYFDVRRWKVADMAVGDDWIYPSYHKGGEGGEIHAMNFMADPPEFFEKVVLETRTFSKQHYFFPISEDDIRKNPNMVQNYGWTTEE
ncbi:MAG: RagB/SusD family nutrient uptake outer membrane protein [Bacteroidales bacterium]|nr:RagB/SusD family nutrient uptake outer membrane protein [Bacteroidales bacterium]